MAEQSRTEGEEVEQLRKDVSALMRHLKILGREKQADVSLVISDFVIDRTNIKYSEPFYTHSCGYKMCLMAQISQRPLGSPRGEPGQTQPPSLLFAVHACLMPGEFDGELKLPIKGHVTIHLLNQTKDADHLKRSKQVSWQHLCKKDPSPIPVILDIPVANLYSNPDTKYLVNGNLKFYVRMNFID